ncbi:hypothetical protein TYRP_019928 [Tyrophagus putrescentiae]|nr:hypothetical protein TYRP_019928 [Tyrophagus putrescentiae]
MLDEVKKMATILSVFRRSWRLIFTVLVPLALSPLLTDYNNKAYLCCYVLLVMALFWMFEPINLYITSLIPVALFPLFGIASTDEVCFNYMKGTVMMFIGGLIMGIALEHSNLHRRLALKIIIFFGSSYKNLMIGIMLATFFQSMWINNTATTAMMIPIVDSILEEMNNANENKRQSNIPNNSLELKNKVKEGDVESQSDCSTFDDDQVKKEKHEAKIVRKAMLLSIVYAANIGGTASLTGTGTNLVLQEVFLIEFPQSTALNFTTWFAYAFPSALLTIFASWLYLCIKYIFMMFFQTVTQLNTFVVTNLLKQPKLSENQRSHEIGVLVHFIVLVLLWFFRYPGWANMITDNKHQIKDATPAILVAISMFIFPANFHQFTDSAKTERKSKSDIKRLLNWKATQNGISWGVVFLLGGGFALAYGIQKSGLATLFAKLLGKITLNPSLTTVVLVVISACVTQLTSNVATANVMLPVICQMAVHLQVNPLLFIVPVTIAISFAFILPISSPSNALVYEHLHMSVLEMAKPGIWMNIIAVVIQLVCVSTFGRLVYTFNVFPDWAKPSNATVASYYIG